MTDTTFPVRLYRATTGDWRLLIIRPGEPVDRWLTKKFTGGAVPTIPARAAALADLGYELDDRDEWHWSESTDPDGAVTLAAGHTARATRP
jgi:hypothetical protein